MSEYVQSSMDEVASRGRSRRGANTCKADELMAVAVEVDERGASTHMSGYVHE